MVSYSHFIAIMVISLAVSPQYTNVTDEHAQRPRLCTHRAAKIKNKRFVVAAGTQ